MGTALSPPGSPPVVVAVVMVVVVLVLGDGGHDDAMVRGWEPSQGTDGTVNGFRLLPAWTWPSVRSPLRLWFGLGARQAAPHGCPLEPLSTDPRAHLITALLCSALLGQNKALLSSHVLFNAFRLNPLFGTTLLLF